MDYNSIAAEAIRERDDLRTQLAAEQAKVRELEYGKALLTKWCAGAEVEIDRLREGLGTIRAISRYEHYRGHIEEVMREGNSIARSLLEVKDE